MNRYRAHLCDGSSTVIRGDGLRFMSGSRPYVYISMAGGELVFVAGLRHVAHITRLDAEEYLTSTTTSTTKGHAGSEHSGLARWIDVGGKIVAILSGLAGLAFIIILASGRTEVGAVHTESLLTMFALSLLGSIISVGGVQLFSVSAGLRRTEEHLQTVDRRTRTPAPAIRTVRSFRLSFETEDLDLIAAMDQARRAPSSVDYRELQADLMAILADSREFRAFLENEADRRRRQGWIPTAIEPNDTIRNGLLLDLVCEKDF